MLGPEGAELEKTFGVVLVSLLFSALSFQLSNLTHSTFIPGQKNEG